MPQSKNSFWNVFEVGSASLEELISYTFLYQGIFCPGTLTWMVFSTEANDFEISFWY